MKIQLIADVLKELDESGFVEYEHFRTSPIMCYCKIKSLDSNKIEFMFDRSSYSFKFCYMDGKFYYRYEKFRSEPIPNMSISEMIVLYK